jgi:hypothetical protein
VVISVGLGEKIFGSRDDTAQLREELNTSLQQEAFLQENLAMLEDSVSGDVGWQRAGAIHEQEFSRGGLDDIVTLSRAMYMSYPLIQRAINVTTFYTFSQGFTIKAEDDKVNEALEAMRAENVNKSELYDHQSQILTDVDQMVDGSIFFALETDIAGKVELISIPVDQIRDIFTAPGRNQSVMFYRRVWTESTFDLKKGSTVAVTKEALYPDHHYYPEDRPKLAGGIEIMWDSPIIHQRTGGLKHMKFGVPEAYAAFEWARAYKKFLEDWHTLVASLAKFAWKATTKTKNVDSVRRRLEPDVNEATGKDENYKRPGAAAVLGQNEDLTPIPKTGATTSAEDARPSRLMVASAMNLPDTILSGDADIGNFATSKTLDRPTELFMLNRQKMWAGFHDNIGQYQIKALQRRGLLGDSVSTNIEIMFPPILEHDKKDVVGAIISAATMDGKEPANTIPMKVVSKMLMEALEIDNIDEAIRDLDSETTAELEKTVESLGELIQGIENGRNA